MNPHATEAQVLKVSHAMVSRSITLHAFLSEWRFQGCLLCSLHGPCRAHLLLYWHLDGLALRTLSLMLSTKIMLKGADRHSWV